MGQLRDKKITNIRTWIDPNTPSSIPELDYDFIYPISVYEAIHRNMGEDSTSLDVELDSIYRLIADKQDAVHGGAPGTLMTWSNIKGQIGETEIVKSIHADPSARSHQKVPSERAVGLMLDTKASAGDFNAHSRDNEIHINEAEREKWNSMAPLNAFREHTEDINVHLTREERETWNGKADGEAFENHVTNANNPHRVTAHQVGTYSRKEVDDMFASIRESFFNYRNIEYDDRTNTATLVEYKAENWNPNFILSYGDDLPEVTDQRLTYFALKPVTDYSTNETADCIIYIKKPGLVWQEVGLQTMTAGDMVIRYPDTTMCVWVQGRFISIFTGSSAAGDSGGTVSENSLMWRPTVSEDGVLGWTKSSEAAPPNPVIIKGPAGYTPIKGIDYFDGASGLGVPAGGNIGDIMVKTTEEDYDVEWKSFSEFLEQYIEEGNLVTDWDSLRGRPTIHETVGDDSEGLMSQKAITDKFDIVASQIEDLLSRFGSTSGLGGIRDDLDQHLQDFNNPHHINPASIGAVSNATFINHTQNFNNPHNVSASDVGLGNVNNTSDIEKPISVYQQQALDAINERINQINGVIGGGNLISNVTWNNSTCSLTFTFRDSSELEIIIPIIDIFKTIYYDDVNNELVIVLPDGSEHRISINYLITTYIGSRSANINVEVENGVIKATILPGTITGDELVESIHLRHSPTTTTQLNDDKSDKIATTKFVKNIVKDNLISYDADRPLSANMGRILNQNKVDVEDVLQIIADTPLVNVMDTLGCVDPYAALSANMGHQLNLTKAPMVHTSPSGSTYGRATVSLFGHSRAGDIDPLMDGTPFTGTDDGYYARADHRHPTDISRAPMHWPDVDRGQYRMTGEPRAETPPDGSNDDRIATTEWVNRNPAYTPLSKEAILNAVRNAFSNTIGSDEWTASGIILEPISNEEITESAFEEFNTVREEADNE